MKTRITCIDVANCIFFSYLRLKFGSVNAANSAMELLKQYRRGGKELTLKHFAEDDSEGN
jgi:hypothetical protein